jgi:imidazole glycerol phosphate synthase subunit HisF
VLAASILHFGDVTVDGIKDVMEARGIPVRRDVGAD